MAIPRWSRGVGRSASLCQAVPSNASVSATSCPLAWPPVTMIWSPTTTAPPATCGDSICGSGCQVPPRCAHTRFELTAVTLSPCASQPPRTTISPRYRTAIALESGTGRSMADDCQVPTVGS